MSHLAAFIYAYGYLGVFSLLLLGIIGLPVPDEWLLTFAGYLIYKGHFHTVPALTAAVLGSVCGISVSYLLGRTLGISIVRHLAGFVAGTSKLRFPGFALFAYTGAFVWSVSFVAIGYFSGKEWPAPPGRSIGTS